MERLSSSKSGKECISSETESFSSARKHIKWESNEFKLHESSFYITHENSSKSRTPLSILSGMYPPSNYFSKLLSFSWGLLLIRLSQILNEGVCMLWIIQSESREGGMYWEIIDCWMAYYMLYVGFVGGGRYAMSSLGGCDFGGGDFPRLGGHLYQTRRSGYYISLLVVCALLSPLLLPSERGTPSGLQLFCCGLLFGVPFHSDQLILTQYLYTQHIILLPTLVQVAAYCLLPPLLWTFCFSGWGLFGCGLALSLRHFLSFLLLSLYISYSKMHSVLNSRSITMEYIVRGNVRPQGGSYQQYCTPFLDSWMANTSICVVEVWSLGLIYLESASFTPSERNLVLTVIVSIVVVGLLPLGIGEAANIKIAQFMGENKPIRGRQIMKAGVILLLFYIISLWIIILLSSRDIEGLLSHTTPEFSSQVHKFYLPLMLIPSLCSLQYILEGFMLGLRLHTDLFAALSIGKLIFSQAVVASSFLYGLRVGALIYGYLLGCLLVIPLYIWILCIQDWEEIALLNTLPLLSALRPLTLNLDNMESIGNTGNNLHPMNQQLLDSTHSLLVASEQAERDQRKMGEWKGRVLKPSMRDTDRGYLADMDMGDSDDDLSTIPTRTINSNHTKQVYIRVRDHEAVHTQDP